MAAINTSPHEETSGQLLRRGYVVLRDFFTDATVHYLRDISNRMSMRASSILEAAISGGPSVAEHAVTCRNELIVVPESSNLMQVCRYEYMVGSNVEFRQFVAEIISPLISGLLDERFVLFKDKTNEKHPGGGAFRPHQDFAAYRHFPPRYYVTVLLAIEPADERNGCIKFCSNYTSVALSRPEFVIQKVGRYNLFAFFDGGTLNGDIRTDITAHFNWETIPLSANDVVIFDAFVPHFSESNKSTRSRRAIFLTFNREDEGDQYDQYYREKRDNYHDPKFHISTPTLRATPEIA